MKSILLLVLYFINLFSIEYKKNIGLHNNSNLFETKLFKFRKLLDHESIKKIEEKVDNLIEINDQKFFIILIASYNNIEYYENNLKSVLDQKYNNYIAIYMDDLSTDGTAEAVKEYLEIYDKNNNFILIKNNEKKYCLKNYIDAIGCFCTDNTIIVTLDGDDWFYHNNVLNQLNEVYKNKEVWITYGDPLVLSKSINNQIYRFSELFGKHSLFGKTISKGIFNKGLRKKRYWSIFHLRSFYTSLFRKIENSDFKYRNNEYFKHTEDVAFMLPMLEMAGYDHYRFIKDIQYVWNDKNILTSSNVWDSQRLLKVFNYILNKKPYLKLKKL
jgi:glycosyltransferase involved in cell wall biosynthesis